MDYCQPFTFPQLKFCLKLDYFTTFSGIICIYIFKSEGSTPISPQRGASDLVAFYGSAYGHSQGIEGVVPFSVVFSQVKALYINSFFNH